LHLSKPPFRLVGVLDDHSRFQHSVKSGHEFNPRGNFECLTIQSIFPGF
jgi:hypothetical protein